MPRKPIIHLISLFLFLPPVMVLAAPDFIKFQDTVNVGEEVKGEAIIIGEVVTQDKVILGDLIALARTITINAPIGGDVRIIAEQVVMNSIVQGNVTVVTGELILNQGAEIRSNVYAITPYFKTNGEIQGDLTFLGDEAELFGIIKGNVDVRDTKKIALGKGLKIGGNFTYTAPKPYAISEGTVSGDIIYKPVSESKDFFGGINWFFEMVWFFAALALGLVIIHLFPQAVRSITLAMVQKPIRRILIGLVFSIIIPVSAVLIAVTLIGLPIALIIIGLWFLMLYIGPLFLAIIIGKLSLFLFFSDKQKIHSISMIWFLIIGLVIERLLFLIPIIGAIMEFFAVLWGMGGIMSYAKSTLYGKQKR